MNAFRKLIAVVAAASALSLLASGAAEASFVWNGPYWYIVPGCGYSVSPVYGYGLWCH